MTGTDDGEGTHDALRSRAELAAGAAFVFSVLSGIYGYVRERGSTDPGGTEPGGGGGAGGGGTPPAAPGEGGSGEGQESPLGRDPLLDLAGRLRTGSEDERLGAFLDTVDLLMLLVVSGGPFLAGWTRHRQFSLAVEEAHRRPRASLVDLRPEDRTEAGLSGRQLDVKLDGLAESLEDLSRSGGRRRYGRALRWARTILDSMAALVPGLHFLKELLETLENMGADLEETDREFRP